MPQEQPVYHIAADRHIDDVFGDLPKVNEKVWGNDIRWLYNMERGYIPLMYLPSEEALTHLQWGEQDRLKAWAHRPIYVELLDIVSEGERSALMGAYWVYLQTRLRSEPFKISATPNRLRSVWTSPKNIHLAIKRWYNKLRVVPPDLQNAHEKRIMTILKRLVGNYDRLFIRDQLYYAVGQIGHFAMPGRDPQQPDPVEEAPRPVENPFAIFREDVPVPPLGRRIVPAQDDDAPIPRQVYWRRGGRAIPAQEPNDGNLHDNPFGQVVAQVQDEVIYQPINIWERERQEFLRRGDEAHDLQENENAVDQRILAEIREQYPDLAADIEQIEYEGAEDFV